jgi:hypothetical protein
MRYIKLLTIALCAIILTNCGSSSSGSGDLIKSIIDKCGQPTKSVNKDKYQNVTYISNDDKFYAQSLELKGHIDKTLNLLPSVSKEGQITGSNVYDHYEWETPQFKVILENTFAGKDINRYITKVFVEEK